MPRPNSRDPESDPAATLGRHLRRLRLAAGFSTQSVLGARIGYGQDVVSKAETGAQPPSDPVYAAWLDVCQASGETREILADLLILARKARGPVPEFFEKYLAAEKEAEYLLLWCPVVMSGLLQVYDYAYAMYLRADLDEDEAAEKAAARLDRQAILDSPDAPHATALLDESVLYRRVGTPTTMVTQLAHLLETSQRRNVIIQVIREEGYYPGLSGNFEIASGDAIPHTLVMVTVEDQTTEDRAVVRKATTLFREIQGHALTVQETRAAIMEAIERWKSQQQ